MKTATASAVFSSDYQTVWTVITDNRDFSWRSDLSGIEILDDTSFCEIAKSGAKTRFIITEKEPFSRYAFRMENRRFTGRWTGFFAALPGGGTKVTLIEEIQVKNPIMRLLAHWFFNLSKIQQQYIADLRKRLGEAQPAQ